MKSKKNKMYRVIKNTESLTSNNYKRNIYYFTSLKKAIDYLINEFDFYSYKIYSINNDTNFYDLEELPKRLGLNEQIRIKATTQKLNDKNCSEINYFLEAFEVDINFNYLSF